jgi:hypothetical protein
MPQFTQWQIVDPTPNVLFNPMAVDESIAKQRSELGNLDINQQRLQLERDKLAQQREAGNALLGRGDTAGTGTTGASTGAGGSFLDALASIESGDKNIVSGVDKDSRGLTLAQGGNPSEISQGHFQIQTATWRDFAKQAGVDVNQYPTAMSAPREVQAQVASVIPLSRFGPRTQTLLRSRFGPLDTNQTVGALAGTPALTFAPGTSGPRVATAPSPPFNPNAGPRVVATPPPAAGTATDALGFDPLNPMRGAPSITGGAPTITGQADPASMEAVKKASVALLAMPEADAAVAYGPTVKALQAQGLAMNAPPTYPGHAALQAIVGQAETTAPAIEPSRQAMRLGGTDVAGPGAGPVTMGPVEQPNTLYQTGLPGVSIRGPGNGLAPPVAAAPVSAPAAPVTAPASAAPPGGRPPILQPPPAPSRVIPMEPLIQSGPAAGLTDSQRRIAAVMITGGTPVADVGAHMAQWRQQNIAGQQQAATNAALEAQANFERQKYIREQQIEAVKSAEAQRHTAETERVAREQLRLQQEDAALKARADKRAEDAAKQANLPTGWRLGEDGKTAYRVAGLPSETKPLPENERKNLLDGGGKLDQVITAQTTFHPTYAGYTFAKAGDLDNLLKAKAGESPQADWWQGYQRYKLAVRQGISGQSLTASELSEFDKADINPGMAPSTIQHNLQLQRELTERIHNRRVKSLEADGYSPEAIKAAGGERPAAPARPTTDPLAAARDAISKGAPRDAVIKRLRENGIDPGEL